MIKQTRCSMSVTMLQATDFFFTYESGCFLMLTIFMLNQANPHIVQPVSLESENVSKNTLHNLSFLHVTFVQLLRFLFTCNSKRANLAISLRF